LYEYFGVLLGCSMQGSSAYPAYDGDDSMYEVHQFMDLSAAEVGYFINQVAMSAASFGVATEDLTTVGTVLNMLFGYKNSAPAVVAKNQPAALQAICIGTGCPTAMNSTTSGYTSEPMPSTAISSLVPTLAAATGSATPAMTSTGSASKTSGGSTSSSTGSPTSNGAAHVGMNIAALAGGFAAMLL